VLTSLTLAAGEARVGELRIHGGVGPVSSAVGLPANDYAAYARVDGSVDRQSNKVAFTIR
jgi:hypothetical protein